MFNHKIKWKNKINNKNPILITRKKKNKKKPNLYQIEVHQWLKVKIEKNFNLLHKISTRKDKSRKSKNKNNLRNQSRLDKLNQELIKLRNEKKISIML